MNNCPCCSSLSYAECCEKYLTGKAYAPTAEALMRSRYTAYSLQHFDYIVATMRSPAADKFDIDDAKAHANEITWTRLEVLSSTANTVEFRAHYRVFDKDDVIHERSQFSKVDGKWYYVNGHHLTEKAGRNDPCPCGSGAKFKKCCG